MEQVVVEVKEMLTAHDDIDKGKTLMVNFVSLGASSLDFFIYCFTRTTDWATYHGVKQDVLIKILKIIEGHGAEVAFPTRTVLLSPPEAEAPAS
jgi:MscS family membrane protein